MLNKLGFNELYPAQEAVAILVGPNGSGKSTFLRNLIINENQNYCRKNIVVVCNTPHDRFSGLRDIPRISTGKRGGSPKDIVKQSVAKSLSGSGADFYQISATLKYCGYKASFGFQFKPGKNYGISYDSFINMISESSLDGYINLNSKVRLPTCSEHIIQALHFLNSHDCSKPIWIDAEANVYDYNRSREFVSIIEVESLLRRFGVIRGISVYLKRENLDEIIELHHASSGQLTLISSLLFIITNIVEDPIVIIDEPENSLHPKWQREYVSHILAALSYRNARVVIASHAPLIVTGALSETINNVSIFSLQDNEPSFIPIKMDNVSKSSIEEILWRAFDVVTPANHFISERLVDEINRYEKGVRTKKQVLDFIDLLEEGSFDERQKSFFNNVKELLDEVDKIKGGALDD